jgi:DNA-binding winged helix-turn-helix (wHTH) protein/tetratricopeptide (TPR) repeat protein
MPLERRDMPTETDRVDRLTFGEFAIDRSDERVLGPAGPVRLGNKAYQVLLQLAEQKGRLLTKDALFTSVWDGTTVSETALTSVIKELRRALGDESRSPRYIESVYGRGYRLIPAVHEGGSAARQDPAPPTPTDPGPAREAGPPLLYLPAFEILGLSDSRPELADVLKEEVLFALSRFRDIRLVSGAEPAASSGGGFGERDYQLSVKLLTGSDDVRVFARLSRLGSNAIIWAETAELKGGSLGKGVDDLVRTIAAAALPRLHDDLLSNPPVQAKGVYDRYLLTKLKMRSQASLTDAREVAADLERLIAAHPDFAPAYPPLTRLYNTDFCYWGLGTTGETERRRAYELAHRAVAIDPSDAHLHTVKGWSHLWAQESGLAQEHLEEALRLNPYNQNRLIEVATAFMFLNDLGGAEELLERRRNLTPFATEAPHEEQGLLHLLRSEFDMAAEQFALVRRHHPEDHAGTKPTVRSELYSVLAAAGAQAPRLPALVASWRSAMTQRWCGPEPLDADRLKAWALNQNPFQSDDRKAWFAGLLDVALES